MAPGEWGQNNTWQHLATTHGNTWQQHMAPGEWGQNNTCGAQGPRLCEAASAFASRMHPMREMGRRDRATRVSNRYAKALLGLPLSPLDTCTCLSLSRSLSRSRSLSLSLSQPHTSASASYSRYGRIVTQELVRARSLSLSLAHVHTYTDIHELTCERASMNTRTHLYMHTRTHLYMWR